MAIVAIVALLNMLHRVCKCFLIGKCSALAHMNRVVAWGPDDLGNCIGRQSQRDTREMRYYLDGR